MLLIPVRLGLSPIHGLGVFALREIATGEEITTDYKQFERHRPAK